MSDPYKYAFRRESDDSVVYANWSVVMDMENGYVTLDGEVMKRCPHLDKEGEKKKAKNVRLDGTPDIISDNLGFAQHQLDDFETDRKANGFSGIEFERDPMEPTFIRVKARSRAEMDRYTKHRGKINVSGKAGHILSPEQLRRAEERVKRGQNV